MPGLGEYLNEYDAAKSNSSVTLSVSLKSSSVSPGNPTIKSEVTAKSFRTFLISFTILI